MAPAASRLVDLSSTVAASFTAVATEYPWRPFLHVVTETAAHYGIKQGDITYRQAAEEIWRLRTGYARGGYKHGHRVGLMLENRPSFFFHWLALNGLGVSVVPLNPEFRPNELDYLASHSEIVLGVAAACELPKLRDSAQRLGSFVAIAENAAILPAPAEAPHADRPPNEHSECALLYTSGTTGRPKGCVLSNGYYLSTGRWYGEIGGACTLCPGEERMLTPLPLVHVNAMGFSAMAMILSGGCLVQLDRFHPGTWWKSVRESRATIIHYLGVMPSMLLGAAPDPGERDHSVRFGFGAGVEAQHHAPFERRFGFPLVEAWAMTETGGAGAMIDSREPRHVGTTCFGRPAPTVEARIVDDAGSPCPTGMPGELLVRAAGPDPHAGFFSEYLKDEEATRSAWDGGWFHTGDVVRSDTDGYLYFVDRKKNVIRRSGENISVVEVESVLRRHPTVAEVAVAPAPDETRGEEVLACIVPRTPLPSTRMADEAASIVTAALADLSYFKVPGWVAFVDALPLTASQKLARGELKAIARGLPGTSDCIDTRAFKRRGV